MTYFKSLRQPSCDELTNCVWSIYPAQAFFKPAPQKLSQRTTEEEMNHIFILITKRTSTISPPLPAFQLVFVCNLFCNNCHKKILILKGILHFKIFSISLFVIPSFVEKLYSELVVNVFDADKAYSIHQLQNLNILHLIFVVRDSIPHTLATPSSSSNLYPSYLPLLYLLLCQALNKC